MHNIERPIMRQNKGYVAGIAVAGIAGLVLTGCSMLPGQDKERDHPLNGYFDALYTGEEYTQEKADEEHAQREQFIAECMAKEGFEYTPTENGGMVVFSSDEESEEDSGPEWGSIEFAKQYGYGIVEWPGMNDMIDENPDAGDDFGSDPNSEYVESLSESEQEAYYEALYGPPQEWDESMEDEDYVYEPPTEGCSNEAWASVNGDQEDPFSDPEFADLMESLNGYWEGVQEDPRMGELNEKWVACVSEEGITDLTDRNSAQDTLQEEWNTITMELNENMGENDEWKEPSKEQKDEFQQREIKAAVADYTCADKLKWDKVIEDIDFEHAEKFVEAHKAELDAMVAKYQNKK